ncbi:Putative_zinc finger in N-recognin (UBR box) and ring finger domain-containing protein [Hexamita inflata]|uniref:E3 ubiquitin-protein ligase n=1 Tax=Hexamita inflata TaxID=28002 RepID=A0AA86NFA1_9EUKA|nr:Putative zinc finger in N-recognin (UBR box) and ring finger domain-containing protein [Hexamita inflata]
MTILEYFESITKRSANIEIIKQFALQQHKQIKQQCCQNIYEHQICFLCQSCTEDPGVLQCNKCFLDSNHEGHTWEAKNGIKGRCDCGDIVAIQPSAFCSTHQIQQQRKVISNTDNIENVIHELWLFINQETNEENVIQIIEDSEALTQIVSVLCLISDENITCDELIQSITQSNFQIFYKQTKQKSCNSLFSRQLSLQQSTQSRLYTTILPSNQFFRNYSFRQIGLYINTIINTSNDNVIHSLSQILNEPLGLYYAGKWGTLDAIIQGIYDLVVKFHNNGKQIVQNKQQQIVDSILAFQGFNYLKKFTAVHSILYYSDSYFENVQNIQQTLAISYSFDPNTKYNNGHKIIYGYSAISQLLIFMWYPNQEIFNNLNLKRIDDQEAEQLCQHYSSIQNNMLFTTQNIDFHVQKIVKIMQSFLKQEQNENVFNIAPLYIPQLYLCSVSRIYKVSVQVLVKKVHQYFSELPLNDLLKKMVYHLIISQKWHILIDQHKIYKQNLADFQKSKEIIDQKIECLFLRYQQIFIIQCLLPLIDDWYSFVTQIFDNDSEAVLHFITLIIFLPLNLNKCDYLKFFLSSTFSDTTTLQSLYDTLNLTYSKNQIYHTFEEIFTSKQLLPLQNEKLELKTKEFIEPMFAFNIEKFYQHLEVLPERVENGLSSVNPFCSSLFMGEYLQNLGLEIITQFQDNEALFSSCLNALRILNCTGYKITNIISEIKNAKIAKLYKVQLNQTNIGAAKIKMMLFLNKKEDKGTSVLEQIKTEDGLNSNQIDECVICHMPIDEIFYVPLQISLHVNQDNHLYQCGDLVRIEKICPHKHHLNCILKSQQYVCSICKLQYQQILMQLTNPQISYYDFNDFNIPVVKNQLLIQKCKETAGLNTIFQHMSYIEYLMKFQQINIKSQEFTEIISNIVCLIKQILVVTKLNKQFNPCSVYNQIQDLVSFNVLQKYLLNQIDFTTFLQSLNTIFEKKQLFTTKLYSNTYNLFKEMLTKAPLCFCQKQINIQRNDAITTQCLACGSFSHGKCLRISDGFIICPQCHSNLGQLFLEGNIIAKSATMVYTGLYQTKFGENQDSIYGEELFLKANNLQYLAFLLTTNSFSKYIDVHDIKYLASIYPVSEVQQMDMIRLTQENKITQEQLDTLYSELQEEEESEESEI